MIAIITETCDPELLLSWIGSWNSASSAVVTVQVEPLLSALRTERRLGGCFRRAWEVTAHGWSDVKS